MSLGGRSVHSPGSRCQRPQRDRCSCSPAHYRTRDAPGPSPNAECTRPRSDRAARRTVREQAGARRAPGWPSSRLGAQHRAAAAAGPARIAAGHRVPGHGGEAWRAERTQELERSWARWRRGASGGDGDGSGASGWCCSAGPDASCSCGSPWFPGQPREGPGAGPAEAGRPARGPGMGTLLLQVSASCKKAVLCSQPQGVTVVGVSKGRPEGTEMGAPAGNRLPGDAEVESERRGSPAAWRDRFRWPSAATRDLLVQNL